MANTVLTQGLVCSYAGQNPSVASLDATPSVRPARPFELYPPGTASLQVFLRTLRQRGPGAACQTIVTLASQQQR